MACIKCSTDLHKNECSCNGQRRCEKCIDCKWCISKNINTAPTGINGSCVPSSEFSPENCSENFNNNNNNESKLQERTEERKEQDQEATHDIAESSSSKRNSDSDYRLDSNISNENDDNIENIDDWSFSDTIFYFVIGILIIVSSVCVGLIIFSEKYRNSCSGLLTTNRLSVLNGKIKEKKKMIYNAILRSKQV